MVRLIVGWRGGGKGSRGSLAIVWWEIGFLVGVGNSGWEALMGRKTLGVGLNLEGWVRVWRGEKRLLGKGSFRWEWRLWAKRWGGGWGEGPRGKVLGSLK